VAQGYAEKPGLGAASGGSARPGLVRCKERLGVVADISPVGSVGVITIATRGQVGPGEVLVKIRGGSETFIAWSPEPLRRGATVLVIESRGERTVDVSEWTDPLDPFPAQLDQR
jgi:hypothetical protein